jgi:hypothetical protein
LHRRSLRWQALSGGGIANKMESGCWLWLGSASYERQQNRGQGTMSK